MPPYHKTNRPWWYRPSLNGIDLSDPAVVGLINSAHLSIQAKSVTDAVDIINRMFMISPVATTLGANACVLDGKDTGWADCRFEIWKRSHDTRGIIARVLGKPLRIGLPKRYFASIWDYLNDVASFPFILNDPTNALAIGTGLYWRDARIKFINNTPVVEFRSLSKQNTLMKDLALFAFVIGRVIWSQQNQEPLTPIQQVRKEKQRAEKLGKNAFSGEFVKNEITKARQGLSALGLLDTFTENLLRML